jgi:hypothetical protein
VTSPVILKGLSATPQPLYMPQVDNIITTIAMPKLDFHELAPSSGEG